MARACSRASLVPDLTPDVVGSVLDTVHISILCSAFWYVTVTGKYLPSPSEPGSSLTISILGRKLGLAVAQHFFPWYVARISIGAHPFMHIFRQILACSKHIHARSEMISEQIRIGVSVTVILIVQM